MGRSVFDTMNYYDGIANGYLELYHEEQKEKISKVVSFFPSTSLMLDLGGGDGVLNEFLPLANLVSFDLSFNLLSLNSNDKKVLGDGSNLPFKHGVFDCVFSFTVFQDISNPSKAVFEVFRVLRESGIFIVSYLSMSSKADLIFSSLVENFEIIEKMEVGVDILLVCKKK